MKTFYCAAPWRGLHINPRGDVKTCCAGNPNMLGNLNSQTIDQILNSPLMAEIRNSLALGQSHEYCSNCVQAERFGAESERHWHNRVNHGFDYTLAGPKYHYPVIVDVRWNTTCNLSCNYCEEKCSSRWAAIKHIAVRSGARPYYNSICDFLEQHHERIHEVALVGGEPLLLPENERLLDVIPQDAIVTLITNLSVDLESNRIFRRLRDRQRVGWSMSFDNIGDRLEYVRHGANWPQIKYNLAIIKDLMLSQGQWGGIHSVYNIYNATRVCELREFAEQTPITVLWQNLFQPEYLDPFLHGPGVAQAALAEIDRFYDMEIATPAERQFFDTARESYQRKLDGAPSSDMSLAFKQHIEQIENQYHLDKKGQFTELWPELSFLLK